MKTIIRKLFLFENREHKTGSVYFWTVLSGGLYSASTFIMFWAVSRLCGVAQAGIFTLAMSVGQQLVSIGYFNVRTFQASDIKEKYSFSQYLLFRIFTSAIMTVIGLIWIGAGDFTTERAVLIGIMILFRVGEAFADVMEGMYQQKERYDVTGKCVFVETALFLSAFLIALAATGNVIFAVGVMTLVYLLSLLIIDCNLVGAFVKVKLKLELSSIKRLFFACLPLFLNSFLLLYVNNSPKYAMDTYQGAEVLGTFNILYMPAFVINLLGGFLVKPCITSLSIRYHEGEKTSFLKTICRQSLCIMGLTLVCVSAAWVFGIPVLQFLYGVELEKYRIPLCIMIFGGAFSALYLLLQYAIVIMRHQYACLAGCVATGVAAAVLMPPLVKEYATWGAALGYLILMVLLFVIYLGVTLFYLKKDWRKQ